MTRPVFILDGDPMERRSLEETGASILISRSDVDEAVSTKQPPNALWIALHELSVHWLAQVLAKHSTPIPGRLLTLEKVPDELATLFADRFDKIAFRPHSLLPLPEIVAVLSREDRDEFCLGGTVDSRSESLISLRGDFSVFVVPLAFFKPSPDASPDFNFFQVIDHGRTLLLGTYEACFSNLLYEFDKDFRKRLKKRRTTDDSSFGASLRRLRKQRGLRLKDLGRLQKTVARLERGEVKRPRYNTLAKIAHYLDVNANDISDY